MTEMEHSFLLCFCYSTGKILKCPEMMIKVLITEESISELEDRMVEINKEKKNKKK